MYKRQVRASSVDVGETLIVTEVEVGLVAVDSHIAFAMLDVYKRQIL